MQIIAHRGASHAAPENTLAAARLAWAEGADALEIDVHLTRDGRLAVIHDPDTMRTAGVGRVVAETTLAELQTLDVGRWKSPAFSGEKVPALEEILALMPADKRIFIEVKGGAECVDALQRALAAPLRPTRLPADQVALISFDLAGAMAMKRALPQHEVCWLADSGADAPRPTLEAIARAAREARLDGIDVDAGWMPDAYWVQQIRAMGFKLYVWTVDDARLARRFVAAGVDGITTNRPGWLRAQLAER